MNIEASEKVYVVLAKWVPPGWLEVVEQFNPPEGDIAYPYMRAAYAAAQARTTTSVEYCACILQNSIHTGCQFNRITENATIVDQLTLQSAKPM